MGVLRMTDTSKSFNENRIVLINKSISTRDMIPAKRSVTVEDGVNLLKEIYPERFEEKAIPETEAKIEIIPEDKAEDPPVKSKRGRPKK